MYEYRNTIYPHAYHTNTALQYDVPIIIQLCSERAWPPARAVTCDYSTTGQCLAADQGGQGGQRRVWDAAAYLSVWLTYLHVNMENFPVPRGSLGLLARHVSTMQVSIGGRDVYFVHRQGDAQPDVSLFFPQPGSPHRRTKKRDLF